MCEIPRYLQMLSKIGNLFQGANLSANEMIIIVGWVKCIPLYELQLQSGRLSKEMVDSINQAYDALIDIVADHSVSNNGIDALRAFYQLISDFYNHFDESIKTIPFERIKVDWREGMVDVDSSKLVYGFDFIDLNILIHKIIENSLAVEELILIEDNLQDFSKLLAHYTQRPACRKQHKNLLEELGAEYQPIINSLVDLYMATPDPDALSDTWTGGRFKQECRDQRKRIMELYLIVDEFYGQLIGQYPLLPIPMAVESL